MKTNRPRFSLPFLIVSALLTCAIPFAKLGAQTAGKAYDRIDGNKYFPAEVVAGTLTTAGFSGPYFKTGTVSNGAATATITCPGMLSTSRAFVQNATTGAGRSILTSVPGSGSLAVVESGNVSTTTTLSIIYWNVAT